MAWKTDECYFKKAIEVSREALDTGNDGFGCILVSPEGEIIMKQRNAVADENNPTAHDVNTMLREAVKKYSPEYLWGCTVYATMEPCCMCTGAAFWANVGNIKYAVSERELGKLLPGGLDIPSRQVIESSGKEIKISGPFESVHDEAIVVIKEWVDKILGK
ncbi:nucleoside deaminase [Clostridium sediminicola]|uniref:nucleoside deaminase n=1 Tax=Clostridium sediminicola TaxID=3114879 RepID=UPI0031F20F7C